MVSGYPMGPPLEPGLVDLGISDTAVNTFTSVLQGVVTSVVGADLTSPSPAAPHGRVVYLLLLHIRFACGVEVDVDLPPIWWKVATVKGHPKGLAIINHVIVRVFSSCWRVFGGRADFSTSLLILPSIKNFSLMNLYPDPDCDGRVSHPHKGTVEA